jgi:hypothetical protein
MNTAAGQKNRKANKVTGKEKENRKVKNGAGDEDHTAVVHIAAEPALLLPAGQHRS